MLQKIIVPLLLLTGLLHCFTASAQKMEDTSSIAWRHGYLDIHHINTGRGVCTFMVLPDGTTMMVDAGDMDDSTSKKSLPLTVTAAYPDNSKTAGQWIADYIHQVLPSVARPVLDYALLTHYHGDHYGILTNRTKTAANGRYKLSGYTEVGDMIPIKKWIDRNSPAYDYPVDLANAYKGELSSFTNLTEFLKYQKEKNGLQTESLKVGSASQITLQKEPASFPGFTVRGIKANGTIWTGKNEETFEYFTRDSILDAGRKFNENPLSIAIRLSYGKFDYYTGGDNTGMQGFGLPKWFDVETPIAKAVGKVEVSTLNHHGNRDGTNETFLRTLQPQVVVEQTWCSDHPGQEVMHRLIADYLYKGKKSIFATNIQEVTKHTLGGWFTKGYTSMFGHVIVRVLPGGNEFYVLVAETVNGKITVQKSYGPYKAQ